jgi:hypothetical protein
MLADTVIVPESFFEYYSFDRNTAKLMARLKTLP